MLLLKLLLSTWRPLDHHHHHPEQLDCHHRGHAATGQAGLLRVQLRLWLVRNPQGLRRWHRCRSQQLPYRYCWGVVGCWQRNQEAAAG